MKAALTLLNMTLWIALPSRAITPIQLPAACGFLPNQGQAPAEVLYYGAMPGGVLYLTREAMIIDTWETERTFPAADDPTIRRRGRVLWVRFDGSSVSPAVEGEGRQELRLNFLIGNDPSRWQIDVPVYEGVSYHDLWPEIDLTLTSTKSGIACALDAGAGADLSRARFELDSGDGAAPAIISGDQLSALLGADVQPETLDDPTTLLWSSFLGGTAEEIGWSTTLDGAGNALLTGLTTSTFFPTTPGAYDQIYSGLGDVFVSKLSADGATLVWSTFLGGTSVQFDYGYAVAAAEGGRVVVTGYTRSEDFPVTPGAYDVEYNGDADVFVTKLNPETGATPLVWSTFLGGASHDIGYDVEIDAGGKPVVAGRTLSIFPTTPGAYDTSVNGEEDGFITKLSAAGDALVWSTLFGGSLYDGIQSIELDDSGAPLVCGYTSSPDFPGGTADGLYDIFLGKFSATGSALTWSRLIGGSSYDYGTDLALDSSGNPVYCGSTGSFDYPVTPGAYDESYNGDDDVVAGKLAGSDGSILWATFIGGSAPVYEIAHGVVLDSENRPILSGATPSPDFPTTPDAFDTSHNGASDAFVLRLNASGSSLEWSSFFGGPGDDYSFELVYTGAGDSPGDGVVTTGSADAGYPVTSGAYDESYNGDIADVFVSRVAFPTGVRVTAAADIRPEPSALSIWPNPMTSTARISFTLAVPAPAKVEVFDVQGRRCSSIDAGVRGPGAHTVDWSARDRSGRPLPSGVYAVRLTAGDSVESRRVVLLR
jgi:hypothetical protein